MNLEDYHFLYLNADFEKREFRGNKLLILLEIKYEYVHKHIYKSKIRLKKSKSYIEYESIFHINIITWATTSYKRND